MNLVVEVLNLINFIFIGRHLLVYYCCLRNVFTFWWISQIHSFGWITVMWHFVNWIEIGWKWLKSCHIHYIGTAMDFVKLGVGTRCINCTSWFGPVNVIQSATMGSATRHTTLFVFPSFVFLLYNIRNLLIRVTVLIVSEQHEEWAGRISGELFSPKLFDTSWVSKPMLVFPWSIIFWLWVSPLLPTDCTYAQQYFPHFK